MKQFIAQLTPNGFEQVRQPALVKGQLVHYHSTVMASHSPYVVTGTETPYGMEALSIPSEFHPEIVRATISASALLHYAERSDPDDYDPALIVPDPDELKAQYEAQRKRAQEEAQKRETQRQELEEKGRTIFESRRPSWAKAVIVAEYEVDKSDMMTDYFDTRTSRTVFLAWSKHTKDLFSEMRKAAATFEETKHLGPGCGLYTAQVVFSQDAKGDYWYSKGQGSPWHRDLYGESRFDPPTFPTREEAKAFIEHAGEPHPVTLNSGDEPTPFEWEISKTSIEHREKYSMGAGYYLKADHKYSTAWKVEKLTIGSYFPYAAAANEDNWQIPGIASAKPTKRVYTFRAECAVDLERLEAVLIGHDYTLTQQRLHESFPDVNASITTALNLSELKAKMREVPDGHVMIRTLEATESPQTDDLPIFMESYSEKALVVRGDTRPHSEALREIGGRFNPRLQGGPGWIFSKAKHTDKVTAFIAQTILSQ